MHETRANSRYRGGGTICCNRVTTLLLRKDWRQGHIVLRDDAAPVRPTITKQQGYNGVEKVGDEMGISRCPSKQ